MAEAIEWVACDLICATPLNPRTEFDDGLDDLAVAIGPPEQSLMVHMPVLERRADGSFRIVAGERRVRAARQNGYLTIQCVVHTELDPLRAMHMRLAENMHRRDVAPIDEAAALRVTWLSENAIALGLQTEAYAILTLHNETAGTIAALEQLLATTDFADHRPLVSWDTLLSRLGIAMQSGKRKRLLRLLRVDQSVAGAVRDIGLSMAATQSMGYLEPEQQQRIVDEVKKHPELASQVRRIARTVISGVYSLDDALREANMVAASAAPATPVEVVEKVSAQTDETQRLLFLAAEISILSMDTAADLPYQHTLNVAIVSEILAALQLAVMQLEEALKLRLADEG